MNTRQIITQKTEAARAFQGPNAPSDGAAQMRVRRRDGSLVEVKLDKIVDRVRRSAQDLPHVDPLRVATKTISGLYDGATTEELDQLAIQIAASLTGDEPEYARLAARLLAATIDEEVRGHGINGFVSGIEAAHRLGLISERLLQFATANQERLDALVTPSRDHLFEYFGLKTLYDRYLLRHPTTRRVLETPQHFFLRVASALAETVQEAAELYGLMSQLEYLTSSPTLFNAGTRHEQLSSCFLLDSPTDALGSIYDRYKDIALLSKFSGGIGLAYHRIRSRGSLIKSTNGHASGIVGWLKTLDASVAAVNQGGKRKGACAVYLEPWHADIEEFLELRDNTGDEARRTHNLNLANWIPDLFMRRVEANESWSLFDPSVTPELPDLYGEEFERAYLAREASGAATKVMPARQLYARMMRTLAQTGNGWMTFKDKANRACNQTGQPGQTVHLSNLCTEILEVTSDEETAVCNLGSINLGRHLKPTPQPEQGADGRADFDFDKLAATVRIAVRQLDRVIDVNYYPISSAESSNRRWRPVGLGQMGLQDVFFELGLAFDSEEAAALSRQIAEHIYFHALTASVELAEEKGAHPAFAETRAARGQLQFDHWDTSPSAQYPWEELRVRISQSGLRNSLLIAIAPTATIASIAGCYECIEPQVSNLFKRETLSGDFLQVNRSLVAELRRQGLWTDTIKRQIKENEGSIANIQAIPEGLRLIYRTAWELPMRTLIDLTAERGAFIDQGQSLNLFVESPNIGRLSSMYMYAFKKGIKTTYYLRSRPATRISQVQGSAPAAPRPSLAPEALADEAVSCSLENPEGCDACQ